MPAGPRIRSNNVYGITSDNPLTPASATFNSVSLPLLPVVSMAHAIVVLDPKRVFGDPEIVIVTVHTAASTIATILRGQYGTSTRQHPQGTAWAHVPVDEDWTEIVTSLTRPSDPYRGQLIFETDTNKFVARSQLDVWQDVVPLGEWSTWTPTLTNMTLGSGTVVARYQKIGRRVTVNFKFTLGAGSAMGTGPSFSLPFAYSSTIYVPSSPFGLAAMTDITTNINFGSAMAVGTTEALLRVMSASGSFVGFATITALVPFTWATTHWIGTTFTYEAVS